MTKLVLQRSKSFLGRKQDYKIWIDEKEAGTIKNNETIELDVPEGQHSLQIGVNKMNGISTVEYFDSIDGQTIHYNIDRPHIGSILFIIVFLLAATAGINVSSGRYLVVFILLIITLALIFVAGKFLIRLTRTN